MNTDTSKTSKEFRDQVLQDINKVKQDFNEIKQRLTPGQVIDEALFYK